MSKRHALIGGGGFGGSIFDRQNYLEVWEGKEESNVCKDSGGLFR
jgi:hypothetical protein